MARTEADRKNLVRTLLIVLVGQVGCLTLLIVIGTVFLGLWLDAHFHTRPLFTLVLLLAGIPLSVVVMLQVARRVLSRLKDGGDVTDVKAGEVS
jgi:uncharacterized membrane protein